VQPASLYLARVRLLPLCLAILARASAGYAQAPLVERVFALEHQSAVEAVTLVYPYLSDAGAVELRPADNALVVKDIAPVLESVATLLRDFDRPAQTMQLEIQIVSAGAGETSDAALSPELVSRLQKLLRYRSYQLVASSRVDAAEGLDVLSALGPDYEVDFRLGLVGADRRVKLHGFKILRRDGDSDVKSLIHTNLNLQLDRPMVLGLARTESSDTALMVVLHCIKKEEALEQ
jgi:hypothetical protein